MSMIYGNVDQQYSKLFNKLQIYVTVHWQARET